MKLVRIFLVAAGVLLLALVVWRFAARPSASMHPVQNKPLIHISLRNPIPELTTGQTPLLVAREKGFFAEQGLDVSLEPGGRGVDPVTMVSTGRDQFGMVGGPETLLVGHSKGLPLKAIAIMHRNSNFPCLLTMKSSGLNTLAQLQGQRVGFYTGHVTTDVLKPLLRRNGVTVIPVPADFNYGQLLTGQIAAQWGFTVRAALELPANHEEVNILRASDYGIITHGYTIFTTEKMIDEKPDVCERLLRGIFKGIDYTLDHREEAADILHRINPAPTRDFITKSENMYDAVLSRSAEYPEGYMDHDMFAGAYQYLSEEKQLDQPFNVDDAFDTRFLERIHHRKFH